MRHRSNDGENPPMNGDRFAVRVTRLKAGQSCTIRTLSLALWGLLTHYVKDRSMYCPGRGECPVTLHAQGSVWKGYIAAELWSDQTKRYYPTVAEITESAELDMRGRYKRGQLWTLSRPPSATGKRCPYVATLLESQAEADCPPPFDVIPLLQQMYHRLDVRLDAENPLPGRIFAAAHEGVGPQLGDVEKVASQEELRSAYKRLMEERGHTNGKGGAS
jgi:hypothetical protein